MFGTSRVIEDSAASLSTFEAGQAVLSPRENVSSQAFLVHNITKGSGLTWIDLKYIFSSLSGRRNIEDVS